MSIKYNGKLIAGKYKTQIVTDATESNKGLIRIATLEEVNTGTDNTTAVTPKDLATKQDTLTAGEGIKIENGVISTESTKILTDNVTIIQNDDNTITSIGTKTKSNTNLYDWVGTEEEYNTGVSSGIITEDTQCIITDDEQELIGTVEVNIPTKVSDLANDSNFVNSVELDTKQDIISDLDTIRAGATLGATALQSIPDEYVTETELNAKGYLTSYTETDPIYTADKPNIANTSLDNLTETGEKHFLNKQQITNCLLEVPQRIKLELNDGTLTLKAGSQVIVPNGFEADGTTPKFDEVVIKNDISQTVTSVWATGKHIICYNRTANSFLCRIAHASGTSPSGDYTIYYNTATNVVRDTDITDNEISLPIGFATVGNLAFTSIDQVFNGIGYIGSTVWVDKGVKGLIPNGRNADGSLKNIEVVTSNVFTQTATWADNNIIFSIASGGIGRWGGNDVYYNEYDNFNYFKGSKIQHCFIGTFTYSNGITSFQPKLPFRAVDYNDIRSEVDGKVSKSGDTMSGRLNFNESPIVHDFISNGNCYVQRTNRILSNADPVDSNIYVSGISIVDETNYEIAKTEIAKLSDGTIRHNFLAHNINGVGTGWAYISVGYKPNGTPITYAPTPPTGDNSSQIATTAWVKALPRLIETWESEWFTIAKSQSHSWNLASTGMNATNSIHIKPEIIAKVIKADFGYAVGDIVYGQWMNYVGSTGKLELGSSLCFTGSTLTFSTGNGFSWGNVKKGGGGGENGISAANAQFKIILRRFSN